MALALEKHLHRQLSEYRLHGEWFKGEAAQQLIGILEAAA
jgi:hypothetical protein